MKTPRPRRTPSGEPAESGRTAKRGSKGRKADEAVEDGLAEAPLETTAGKTTRRRTRGEASTARATTTTTAATARRPPSRKRDSRSGTALAAEAIATEASANPTAGSTGIPTGSAALAVLALLAVPCVVTSVIYPLATFAITGVFGVVTRAVWTGHWLVRNHRSPGARRILAVLAFPLTLAASLVSAVAWPGIPAGAAAFITLWATTGARLEPDWWTQTVPVTVAGVVFGVVSGGIIGREVERVGTEMPELRREGLRALAVLGGFVALCAAAVQAVSLLV